MLIQYLRYKFLFLSLSSLIICSNTYFSNWGNYSINNQSYSINNQEIINVLENHINHMNSKFYNIRKSPFEIIISNQHNSLSSNKIWDWSLGVTLNNSIIIKDISKTHISKKRIMQVLRHELNHLYLNRLVNKSYLPRWFEEGFAMYYANENLISNKFILAKNINNQHMFNLEILNNQFNSHSKKQFNFAYAYSQFLFLDLINNYSEEIIINIILDVKSGYIFDDAFYKNTLLTVSDYNKKASKAIYLKFWWFKFMKLPSLLLILAPLLSIVGFIIVKIKNKKIIKKWDIEEKLDFEDEAKV